MCWVKKICFDAFVGDLAEYFMTSSITEICWGVAKSRHIIGRCLTDCRQIADRLPTDCRQIADRLPTDCRHIFFVYEKDIFFGLCAFFY